MKRVNMTRMMNVRRKRRMKKERNGSKIVSETAGVAVTDGRMKMRKRIGTGRSQARKMSQTVVKGGGNSA